MSTDVTQQVADFVVGLRYGDLTPSAIQAAKWVILDAVGVALAGSLEDDARIVAELTRDEGSRPASVVFGQGFRASSTAAAFANGVAVHALDFDSSYLIMGQPMAGLVPAIFALAEPLGASGQRLLTAYVAGYEVTAKIGRCAPGDIEGNGWHSTATVGTMGCTAAAAGLLGLSVEQTRNALGIASSMASGLIANFGTMSKPLHAGLAARNGVQAAKLAQRAFTGNASSLESGKAFFHSFAGGSSHDVGPLLDLGAPFEVDGGVRYKPYPCGGLTHSAIDAMLALRREYDLHAEAIETIDVAVTRGTAERIVFREPETGIQGKFCMPYILARAVLDGQLVPDTFTDEAVRDPDALALGERVTMHHDASLDSGPRGSRPSVVRVVLRDGREVERRVDFARGGTQMPLGEDELRAKFTGCASRVLGDGPATELLAMLETMEEIEDVSSVSEMLLGTRDVAGS